ncbi:MAG: cupin domain-containing protein [Sulfurovum sp.]|nr:cupin domain-containing protein [Sulfurovum sp.]MDD3602170.1 cupin domain-containing protein [Sulfurovum sp.]
MHPNLYDYTVPQSGEEFTSLLEYKKIKIVRIVSSAEVEPIEYIQEEDEWVLVIRGEAVLVLDQKEIILKEGDHLFIPSKTPHRVLKTKNETLWLALHLYR